MPGSLPPGPVTELLAAHRAGDDGAFERLVCLLYDDLRALAHRQLGPAQNALTLDTTSLAHEAYLKVLHREELPWRDRPHLLAVTARAMRQLIIDHARARVAVKRGAHGGLIPFDETLIAVDRDAGALLALDDALERLGQVDARKRQVVECRFFGGLTAEDTASALGMSLRTVEREWTRARAWLRVELSAR